MQSINALGRRRKESGVEKDFALCSWLGCSGITPRMTKETTGTQHWRSDESATIV